MICSENGNWFTEILRKTGPLNKMHCFDRVVCLFCLLMVNPQILIPAYTYDNTAFRRTAAYFTFHHHQ